jgi:phosphate transport system permease protein
LAAAAVAAVCLFIVGYIVYQGYSHVDWTFLTTDPDPSPADSEGGGVRIPIAGTTFLVLLSTLLTFPLALGAALYLAEYMDERSPLTKAIRLGLEVLAGVPSVVFGMFGVAMFSQGVFTFMSSSGAQGSDVAFGRSFLVAATVMAIHVLPFVIKVMEEAIRSVPMSYRQGAAALGITRWRALRKVVLPAATPGIVTAVILGMGLAAGDTAIVWLTLGGTMNMAVDNWWHVSESLNVLRGTGSTLTTFIYFASPAGEGNAEHLAYGGAMVLMLLVISLNAAATFVGRFGRQAR